MSAGLQRAEGDSGAAGETEAATQLPLPHAALLAAAPALAASVTKKGEERAAEKEYGQRGSAEDVSEAGPREDRRSTTIKTVLRASR